MNNPTLLAGLAMLAASITQAAESPGDAAKGKQIAAQICAACHGVDGNSAIPINPSLAGQHPEYLLKQLKDFKSGARKSAMMAPMVAPLGPEDMRNIAAYFAAQAPRLAGAKDAGLAETGRVLYRGGNMKAGVPACAGCHLPTGAGIPAQYPRLAGQHPEYTAAMLKAFRSGERANDDGMGKVMRSAAARLSDAEIAAVAEYVSGLR